MSLMHMQRLKLLLPIDYEEMHSTENTLFDHWPENVVQCPLYHVMTYASAKFEVATSKINERF